MLHEEVATSIEKWIEIETDLKKMSEKHQTTHREYIVAILNP